MTIAWAVRALLSGAASGFIGFYSGAPLWATVAILMCGIICGYRRVHE